MLSVQPILPLPAPPTDGDLGVIPVSQLPLEKEKDNENQNNAITKSDSVATHGQRIWIIHPPPDIRRIIDKTSQFVAKRPDYEKKITIDNAGNVNFNFLTSSDPYHAYYQHKLSEFRAQNQNPTQQPFSQPSEKSDPSEHFRPLCKVLEPLEEEQYTVRLPEGITGEELYIIKLTAQFVARNGKSFLTGLTSREMNNPRFRFLKPTHSMFMFFTALADAYSKVLMPEKGLTGKLRNSVVDRTTVLERCLHRLEWEKSQEQARQKAENEIEQERVQMAMIDWHDFVVIATIDFADDEDERSCMPMTHDEFIRRSKISADMNEKEVVEADKEVEMEMDEEEMQLVQDGIASPMRIVKNWKRPEERIQAERESSKYVVSSRMIPTNEMSEHVRISLIDPEYKEQNERMFAKIKETTLAQDDEIARNIVRLARTRPDIFGTTEEEVSNAVKFEIEKKKPAEPKPVIWDGHSGSIVRPLMVSRNQTGGPPPSPMQLPPGQYPMMMMNRPLMQPPHMHVPPPSASQFTRLGAHRPFTPMPPMHGMPVPPPPPEDAPPPLPEEPESKRQKLDDSALVQEEQFLAQHPGPNCLSEYCMHGPFRIKISVPRVDEGNLKGQVLEISMQSLSETVGSLKEKISAEIQLPANKQKLSGKAGFLKDNLTLAYYNVGNGESLALSLRERGGRKR